MCPINNQGKEVESKYHQAMSVAAVRPLSALLTRFPIRTLASADEPLREKEILVKCRGMSGEDHIIALADWQLSSTIALFAGHIMGVDYTRIYLSVQCDELGYNCPMVKVKELIEKTDGVVQFLVMDPPKVPFMNWNRTDVLVGRPAYGRACAATSAAAGDSW